LGSKFTPSRNYVNGDFTVDGDVYITGSLSASAIVGGGSTTPGLPATSVQYNDGGAFAGDADFTWNKTTNALTVTGDITASANISGAFFHGDGSGLTGVSATASPAGSNTEIQFNADGVTAADVDLTWLTGSNTLSISGDISGSGNISGSAFYGDGANLTNLPSAAITTYNNPNATSVITSVNGSTVQGEANLTFDGTTLAVTGDVSASVNISGSDFYGGGANLTDLNASSISAGTLANARLPATISVTNVTASTEISASFLYGDGSNLTNLPAGSPAGSDTEIQFNDGGSAFGADPQFTWNQTSNTLTVTGDISASVNISGSSFYGDGSNLTNLPSAAISTYDNPNATSLITSVNGTTVQGEANLTFDGTTLSITGDVSGSGNISGSAFYGDGSNLTNLPAGNAAGLDTQIQFNDGGTAFGGDAELTWNKTTDTLTVTGDISASVNISGSDFYGGGANLTDLNASNVSAGTLDNARLPATISVTNVTASTEISASLLYGDGSNLTGLARDYGPRATNPPGAAASYTEDFESTSVGFLPTDWTSYGDATWIVSASNPHAGTKCAISQDIGDNQAASLVYTASVSTPAVVTFWWDVSSESGFDFLRFYKDEVLVESISGTPGYAQVTTNVESGSTAFRWEYFKDTSATSGEDQGYVDDFQITPITWSAGDFYYNTSLNMTMHYDLSRNKWLSAETAEITFGRNGFTGPGAYYRGPSDISYSDSHGRYAEHSGTVVSLTYAKTDLANTSFVVTAGGATVSTVASPIEFKGSDSTLNDDFSANTVLGVKNITSGATTEDVMGVVRIKWRI